MTTLTNNPAEPQRPGENPEKQPENAQSRLKIGLKSPHASKSLACDTYSQNTAFSELKIRTGRRPAEKVWPDRSKIYQHFGANLPTPNINISGVRFQQIDRALAGYALHGKVRL